MECEDIASRFRWDIEFNDMECEYKGGPFRWGINKAENYANIPEISQPSMEWQIFQDKIATIPFDFSAAGSLKDKVSTLKEIKRRLAESQENVKKTSNRLLDVLSLASLVQMIGTVFLILLESNPAWLVASPLLLMASKIFVLAAVLGTSAYALYRVFPNLYEKFIKIPQLNAEIDREENSLVKMLDAYNQLLDLKDTYAQEVSTSEFVRLDDSVKTVIINAYKELDLLENFLNTLKIES